MAARTAEIGICGGEHAVHFYEDETELGAIVGSYLRAALAAGGAVVVIATAAHRQAFEAELEAAGIDVTDEAVVLLDAAATMTRFMPGGRIDRGEFQRVIGGVVRRVAAAGRPLSAYGEMVALLWDAGDVMGAIELEELWNELMDELEFSLLCAYHRDSVAGPEHAEALTQVCRLHSSVLDAGEEEVSADFYDRVESPAAARHLVARALRRWGFEPAFVRDAELVASELATNAVVHAGSCFTVAVRPKDGGALISVRDGSPLQPVVRDDEPDAMSGRGLRLVSLLADAWGVEREDPGKIIWAALSASARTALGLSPGR